MVVSISVAAKALLLAVVNVDGAFMWNSLAPFLRHSIFGRSARFSMVDERKLPHKKWLSRA